MLRAIDRSLVTSGTRMVFLLRLSPIIPFYICNYVLGATQVSIRDFAVGSLGMLPWIITCSYMGNALKKIQDVSLRHISASNRVLTILCYGVGGAITLTVLYVLGVYTRRAFKEVSTPMSRREDHATPVRDAAHARPSR